jgi:hypothetical protein
MGNGVVGNRDGHGVGCDLMEGEVGKSEALSLEVEAEAVDSLEVEDVPRPEVETVNKWEVQEACRHGTVAVHRVRHEMEEVPEGHSIDRQTVLHSLRQATWSRWQCPSN